MIRHIVLFSVTEQAAGEVDLLIEELLRLPARIAAIDALSCGRPLNDAGFDCALIVDVADEARLAEYRKHPDHQQVLERLHSVTSQIVVADIVV
jgi:Stress responsive A/B Barrel Domain